MFVGHAGELMDIFEKHVCKAKEAYTITTIAPQQFAGLLLHITWNVEANTRDKQCCKLLILCCEIFESQFSQTLKFPNLKFDQSFWHWNFDFGSPNFFFFLNSVLEPFDSVWRIKWSYTVTWPKRGSAWEIAGKLQQVNVTRGKEKSDPQRCMRSTEDKDESRHTSSCFFWVMKQMSTLFIKVGESTCWGSTFTGYLKDK